jgi:O-antigen/teichoic acid export membrane protein
MILLGNLVMWMYIPKTVLKVKINFTDIVKHIIPAIQLFIPQIAIQVYVVLDKTMLGTLTNTGEVGLYEQSQKIIMLVLGLVTSLGVVMLPRMSNTFANGDNKKMNEYLNKSLQVVSYISIPMSVGIAAVSNKFVPWFFGKEFNQVSYLIIILTPILFFIAISNVLGIQYLLPSNRTKEFTASVTIGAIINVILNLILIPKYKALGTCIATVIAEFGVTLVQYIALRKNIEKKTLFLIIIKYMVSSAVMFITVRIIGIYMGPQIMTTIIQGIVGVIVYVSILILLKDKINLLILKTVISKLKIKAS